MYLRSSVFFIAAGFHLIFYHGRFGTKYLSYVLEAGIWGPYSVALVRERTIPTERPPPVGEVSANFCGYRGVAWSAQRVPTAVKLCFLDLEPLLFLFK